MANNKWSVDNPLIVACQAVVVTLLFGAWGTPTPERAAPIMSTPIVIAAEPKEQAWKVEWEETLVQAREEGKPTLEVSAAFLRGYKPAVEYFESKFRIKLNVAAGGRGARQMERITAERAAGIYEVDYLGQGLTTVEPVIAAGALQPVANMFILPEVKDESLWFQGRHYYADREGKYVFRFVGTHRAADFAVNTELVLK